MFPGFTADYSLADPRPPYDGSGEPAEPANEIQPALPCLYGRWCGPGCSGPGNPVDDLDACCKAHDICYDRRGYLACSCDRALLNCVQPKINPFTRKGRAALLVWSWFRQGWCNPFA